MVKIHKISKLYALARHYALSTTLNRLKFDVFPEKRLTRDVFSQKRAQMQLIRARKRQMK